MKRRGDTQRKCAAEQGVSPLLSGRRLVVERQRPECGSGRGRSHGEADGLCAVLFMRLCLFPLRVLRGFVSPGYRFPDSSWLCLFPRGVGGSRFTKRFHEHVPGRGFSPFTLAFASARSRVFRSEKHNERHRPERIFLLGGGSGLCRPSFAPKPEHGGDEIRGRRRGPGPQRR
jgi:hypothetical protein